MKDLIFAASAVCICASVIGILAPDGKGGLKKQISFACALAVCSALLLPTVKLVSSDMGFPDIGVPDVEVSDKNEAEKAIAELTAEKICREMERQVESRFDISSPTLTLSLDISDPTSITITSGTLYGEGELNEAAEYIKEQLGCEIYTESPYNE